MAELKKYNLEGQNVGVSEINDVFGKTEVNGQMVKDYIVALRANARQWSACTLGRSEVSHSTQKPHRQKGTGKARQGSLAAPQYKGGGRVFTPKPKFDQHIRINKKERRQAIRQLIGEKVKAGHFHVIENTGLAKPQTKVVANFLKSVGVEGKRVLFLGESATEHGVSLPCGGEHENFRRSLRNIPKTEFLLVKNASGYDVLVASDIVITEKALQELHDWLA